MNRNWFGLICKELLVRAVFKWCLSIETIFEIFKYLINKKKIVYGWQGDYMW